MKMPKVIASLLCCAMLSFSAQGCAGTPTTKQALKESIQKDTALIMLFSATGEVTFLDRDGNILPACEFCDVELERKWGPGCKEAPLCTEELEKEFGPGCEEAQGKYINICPGTIRTQVQDLTSIGLLRHKGSGCFTGTSGGAGGHNSGVCYDLCAMFPGVFPECPD